jgi:hypothetical protein
MYIFQSSTDASKRIPEAALFKEEALVNSALEILDGILQEPIYGDSSKAKVVKAIISRKDTEEWKDFFVTISNFICDMVCQKQSKILPANQYEDFQKKLNIFLNQNDTILRDKFLSVLQEDISCAVAGRLVFRIATLMLKKVQVWVLCKMQSLRDSDDVALPVIVTMSDEEKKAFLNHLGNCFRSYFSLRMSKTTSTQQSRLECECIKDNFVYSQQPISKVQFLDRTQWFSGEEDCILISGHADSFFTRIETEIIPTLRAHKGTVTSVEVIEQILECEDLLNHWFHLTNAYLPEEQSLLFMREITSAYVKSSLLLEEKQRNRFEESAIRATSVALRTHLQHNFSEKPPSVNV